jgi:hypothetical protein
VRAMATIVLFLAPPIALADCKTDWVAHRRLLSKEPVSSAKLAIVRGDLKFLGVAGYSISVPEVDSPKCTAVRSRVRVIEGTSDTPCGAEGVRFQKEAMKFAQNYNAVIRAHLDKQQVKYATCAL